jgi:hypothetical protein
MGIGPLEEAIMSQNVEQVLMLLEHGFSPDGEREGSGPSKVTNL